MRLCIACFWSSCGSYFVCCILFLSSTYRCFESCFGKLFCILLSFLMFIRCDSRWSSDNLDGRIDVNRVILWGRLIVALIVVKWNNDLINSTVYNIEVNDLWSVWLTDARNWSKSDYADRNAWIWICDILSRGKKRGYYIRRIVVSVLVGGEVCLDTMRAGTNWILFFCVGFMWIAGI